MKQKQLVISLLYEKTGTIKLEYVSHVISNNVVFLQV